MRKKGRTNPWEPVKKDESPVEEEIKQSFSKSYQSLFRQMKANSVHFLFWRSQFPIDWHQRW